LTLCNVEVFGYAEEKKKKDDGEKKANTVTDSLQNAAATITIDSEDVLKVKAGTNETIKTVTNTRHEDSITTVDVNTEVGWNKWIADLKATRINLVPNSGFMNVSQVVKTNGFIELVGSVNNDAGYEWFWEATNGFRLKNVQTVSYVNDGSLETADNKDTQSTVHILLQVLDNGDKKEFDLKSLYQPGYNYNRYFRDGMRFKVDGKEEDKIHLTTYKVLRGSIWNQVKAGIINKGGNDGSERLEHGGYHTRVHTLTKTYGSDGTWQTTSIASQSKTRKSYNYKAKTTEDTQ
jgi:hypothetical protein